eukprot:m.171985 g.171985  ORF g.171985 m.171985 type:complete len:161 (-) comp9941_c0_seq5:1952-2434(-)
MPATGPAAVVDDHSAADKFAGLMMVLTACFCSGFAGIYFEKMLKGETSNIWIMNVLLGSYGAILASVGMMYNEGQSVLEHGFFHGYTVYAYSGVALQAFGGLVVAVVVKYADNILKGFATSISIVISCIVSIFLFGFVVTSTFALGATLVIAATFAYSYN